jgi:[Skp1-protein]-hydroxyproline N-acetylglucosaminyltransferase
MEETIFVSIPSYRDPECQWTIKDLFEKAIFPDRIFVGICWQYDMEDTNEDAHCFEIQLRQNQIRTINMHWKNARGPCIARHIAQTLWQNEKYYLQIDSHMRFVQGWDQKLIQYLSICPSKKPILTTYPVGYELPNKISNEENPPVVIAKEFGKRDNMLRLNGSLVYKCPSKIIPSLFWVSGFAFSSSQVIKEVNLILF